MYSTCSEQYAKYGNYIPMESMGISFDIRMGQQFIFFIVFAILSGALANNAASQGLSFSRAISIVFLLNELE